MKDLLKELYYGNIDPQSRSYQKNSKAAVLSAELSNLEEKLCQSLSGEDLNRFKSFSDNYLELLCCTELDTFIYAFRLGAGLTLDTFCKHT